MDMVFQKFFPKHGIDALQSTFLLTVSGGVDSIVVFDLFLTSGYSFEVAHCNFNLRGKDALKDQILVKELCEENKIKFHLADFDTNREAELRGVSIQETARDLRYKWFERLTKTENLDFLVTAHHANDNLESVLYNFTKGTHFAGLRGVAARKEMLIRPLISFTKEEIRDYAQKHELKWREDVSNESNKYARNSIRNQVVPVLKNINPSLENTALSFSEYLADANEYIKGQLQTLKLELQEGSRWVIPKDLLNTANHFLLTTWLFEVGFTKGQIRTIFSLAKEVSGKKIITNEYQLNVQRNEFVLFEQNTLPGITLEINKVGVYQTAYGTLIFTQVSPEEVDFTLGKHIMFVDQLKLDFPLQLTTWQEGDAFKPFGMNGKKKLSDFLIDAKVELLEKQKVLTLKQQDKIVCVLGYRLDNDFRLIGNETTLVRIEWVENT